MIVKKIIKVVFVIFLMLVAAFLSGCSLLEEPKDGLSAYEIAVKNGFVGSEQDWLDSIKGEQGDIGPAGQTGMTGMTGEKGEVGYSAYQIAISLGFSGSEQEWIDSLKGAIGEKGEQGATGQTGSDGIGISNVKFDKDGNLIITLTNGDVINAGNPESFDDDTSTNAPILSNTEINIPVNSVYLLFSDRPYCKFESSDPTKIQVTNDGLIVALSEGSAEIKVTARDGKSSICKVNAVCFSYKILKDNTIEITGYTGNLSDVIIPSDIKGLSVSSIGNSAFADYFGEINLTSVSLPDSVERIGSYAFSSCEQLKNVTFGSGVKEIGNAAFSGCFSLVDVTLPDSLEFLGNTAFNVCESLKSVIIPNSVKSIGGSTFYGCSSLETINFGTGVESIGMLAFAECTSLSSVIIPEQITYIDEYAFSGCFNLSEVVLGEKTAYYDNSFENTPWYLNNQHSDVTITNDIVWATGAVKIRTMPSLENSLVYDYASAGDKFNRIGIVQGDDILWAKVEIEGSFYYISMNYLTTEEPIITN